MKSLKKEYRKNNSLAQVTFWIPKELNKEKYNMYANEKECDKAGLDIKEVELIAKNLSKYCKRAKKLGLEIFGGSGEGSLRFFDKQSSNALIVAYLDSDNWNGGDGSIRPDQDGYLRGE